MDYLVEYENLIKNLKNKRYINVSLVEKAYELAKTLHEGQFRKSGEPYIAHPVAVASILERLNFDEDVICAGILHDVVEDCDCTVEDLKERFNARIANLVDSVTAIVGEKKERTIEFQKFLLEEATYNKLYSIAMTEKLAFYIKFADRLHNLRTIGIFPRYKQIEKVKETEKYLLPVLVSIKANTLYYQIKNECFKIVEPEKHEYINDRYELFLNKNRKYFEEVTKNFNLYINNAIDKKTKGVSRIILKQILPYEISLNQLPKIGIEPENIKEFMFNNLVTHKFFIILKSAKVKVNKHEILYKLFSSSNYFNNFKIMGFMGEEKTKEAAMIIEDPLGNKCAVLLHNEKEYFQYNNGVVEGVEIPYDEELNQFEISENYITVKTNKGHDVLMPEKSTVLDFAFKIHNDFGFSCTGAYLNHSPTKVPIYTKLNSGDRINLTIERDEETKACLPLAKIRWLSYVNTEYAKKKLSKYFEIKYES
jgi:GTP pyrophosphokinase